MDILLAEAMGMCFGVRDALAITDTLPVPAEVTILGELVHNPVVLHRLAARGFHAADTEQIAATTPQVLITAHGVSEPTRLALQQSGKTVVDTTCPLVQKVHHAARRLETEGFHVVILGQPWHVEVRGIGGNLSACTVIERPEQVQLWPHPKLGIVCQTTLPVAEAARLCAAIQSQNPHAAVRFIDTICQPTKDRQQAMETLLEQASVVVVVGGRQSSNTRKLVERCLAANVPAFHVEQAGELQPAWFRRKDRVGLTAGTSTLPETIAAVHIRLQQIARDLDAEAAYRHAV